MTTPLQDRVLNTRKSQDHGRELRKWLSSQVKKKMKKPAMLSQFEGCRNDLITKEEAVKFEKGLVHSIDYFFNEIPYKLNKPYDIKTSPIRSNIRNKILRPSLS